jgi:hypothetical protein
MSRCRITKNQTSGSGFTKTCDTELSKEMNSKLKDLMELRNKQDAELKLETLSEKEYETKYGKQPKSTDSNTTG